MTEQKNTAPQPLSDEDLEAATGGAAGFNPLYGLSGDPYSPINSPVMMTGSNPLHVPSAEPYVPLTVPQAHAPAPQPAPEPTMMVAPSATLSPSAASAPPAQAPEPTVVALPDAALSPFGSLNIAAPTQAPLVVTGSVTFSAPLNIDIPKDPNQDVTVLTFEEHEPAWTVLTPTVRPVRPAGESNNNDRIQAGGSLSPLESAFDLGLVKT